MSEPVKARHTVIGVMHRQGRSPKTGGEYDMKNLLTLKAIEPLSRPNMTLKGTGFENKELAIAPDAIEQVISQAQKMKLPRECDITFSIVLDDRNEHRAMVVGIA